MILTISIRRSAFGNFGSIGQIGTLMLNPLNMMEFLGNIDNDLPIPQVFDATGLYAALTGLGLPSAYVTQTNVNGGGGLRLVGPNGFIPFKLLTVNSTLSADTYFSVPGPAFTANIQASNFKTLGDSFESLKPKFIVSGWNQANIGGPVTPFLLAPYGSSSSVNNQNVYQESPAVEVRKTAGPTLIGGFQISALLMRNSINSQANAGASIKLGPYSWDETLTLAQLGGGGVFTYNAGAQVYHQFTIQVDDALIESASTNTGRIYAVTSTENAISSSPLPTFSANMISASNGLNNTLAAVAIDLPNNIAGITTFVDIDNGGAVIGNLPLATFIALNPNGNPAAVPYT